MNNGNGHVRPPVGWTSGNGQDFAGGHSRISNDELNAWINQTSKPPEIESRVNGVYLDTVKPEAVQWLWQDYIPVGTLSLWFGDPGLGKSTITLDIGSRLSRGSAWPAGGQAAEKGMTVLLTAEDGLANTVRPRIDRQGGDASKFFAVTGVIVGEDKREFSLQADLIRLEKQIEFLKPRLVVIDPLSAYLGDKDSYKDSEIRSLLRPLAELAEKHNVAILCIVHMNKSAQGKALYRALGSIAFTAAARAVFAIAIDPNDKERRLFLPVKTNLSKMPPGLSYRFDETGKIVWDETPLSTDMNADCILGMAFDSDDAENKSDAEDFLETIFKNSEAISAQDVLRDGRLNGINEKTLQRAKKRLGITSEKVENGWFWIRKHKDFITKMDIKMDTFEKMSILNKTNEQSQLDHDFNQDGHFSESVHLDVHLAPELVQQSKDLISDCKDKTSPLDDKCHQESDDAFASRDDNTSGRRVEYTLPMKRKKTKR